MAFLSQVATLSFHCFSTPLKSGRPCQQPLEPASGGLWSPACCAGPPAGLSSKSMSSSLCGGGVVEEGRAVVLPKRLRLSRDEPEDRVDTRLTGRSLSPSTGSPHGRLQHSGPESSCAWSCLLLESGGDDCGDSGRWDEKKKKKNNHREFVTMLLDQRKVSKVTSTYSLLKKQGWKVRQTASFQQEVHTFLEMEEPNEAFFFFG